MLALVFMAVAHAVLSFRSLLYLGHFSALHPLPRKSGMLTLFFVFALAGFAAKYATLTVFGIETLRYREILILAGPMSLLVFLYQFASGVEFIRSRRQRRVYVALMPDERASLEEAFRERGIRHFYRIEDVDRLKQSPVPWSEIDWIAISRSRVRNFLEHSVLISAHLESVPVLDYRQLRNAVLNRVAVSEQDAWFYLTQATRSSLLLRIYREIKPWIERVLAAVALLLLLPVFAAVAAATKAFDRGPVFFVQERLGYRGKRFRMVKFRSMRVDAEKAGAVWASEGDDRVTAIGKFLRKTRIDELPQIWNVLRGEMSFVGPRPERPEFYAVLDREIPLFKLRLLARPGITGWAQVMGGYAASVEESRAKLEYDLFYIQFMSLRLDLVCLFRTVTTAVLGRERIRRPSRDAA